MALRAVLPEVHVKLTFCTVVVLPTKLRLTALAPVKFAAFAPENAQPLTVLVAGAPVPEPPDGVTAIEPLPVLPTVVTPVKATVVAVVGL